MQALTPTLFPCYAAADREIAASIAAFVERGADVRVFFDEGAMQPGEGLAEKARDARVADIVLVLFSRNSLPSRWPRAQWEAALLTEPRAEGVRIGFVKCDDCIPPRVLEPLFDVSASAVSGLRRIKRWVRGHEPTPHPQTSSGGDLEVLGIAIADRPGVDTAPAAVADEFVEAFAEDFDAVLRLPCAGRSMAAIAGDLAEQLGLRLEGDVESNVERLQQFCSNRRFLFVMEGGGPLGIEGRCSTLVVPAAAEEPAVDAESLRGVQRALGAPSSNWPGNWPELCRLARIGRRLTREAGRIAELYELMEEWHTAARERDDRAALDESAREMVWILEGWGRMAEAQRLEYSRAIECDEQLPLPFVELG